MSYRKRQELLLGLTCLTVLAGCTSGIDGGSIEKVFSGIHTTTVTGPESVQIDWTMNSSCEGYGIYRLGSDSNNNKIADASVPPYTVKAPNVESERSYSFAVGCNRGGKVEGLSNMKSATTWPKFSGILTANVETGSSQTAVVHLKWNYNYPAVSFDIYSQVSPLPDSLTTMNGTGWMLNAQGGAGSGYSNAKLCTVSTNEVRLGEQGCPTLTGGQGYMFKIVAHYPDGTYSTDLAGVGAYADVPPPFEAPDCALTSAGIGADPSTSSLFLRCTDQQLALVSCSGTMTAHAYQGISGVRTSVSDTLTGAGTLRIQPQTSSSQANDRQVQNLEIEYDCTQSSGAVSKSIVHYDGNQAPRPVLKFNSNDYVRAPSESKELIPSYYGKAMAVGDFNCDGKPDLAVGMPTVTFNQAPYFSKNPESGVVAVYYDYTQSANGSISASDIQYLSFSDLPAYADFGASLSSGNINRDYHHDIVNDRYYSCDDLIVGAPGSQQTNNSYYGEAYIFYGHPQKFSQPQNISTLTVNNSSCHGSLDSSVCDPVRLVQDVDTYYKIYTSGMVNYGPAQGVDKSQFGFSVAYVRDFNADGYGDIAIGNPYCNWDGAVKDGHENDNGGQGRIYNVGCVYVYWGGPNGIQSLDVGPAPSGGSNRLIAPFVKVYPPFPQKGMHFGWSVAGGGDIDGKLPVPMVDSAGDLVMETGSDFVVGAPGFHYNVDMSYMGHPEPSLASWSPTSGVPDPQVTQGASSFTSNNDTEYSNKITVPFNGAWADVSSWSGTVPAPSDTSPLYKSSGIAFTYLGRSSPMMYGINPHTDHSFYLLPDDLTVDPSQLSLLPSLISASQMSRQNGSRGFSIEGTPTQITDSFYNCGSRGAPTGDSNGDGTGYYRHISCLAGRNNFSVIFPQLSSTDLPVTGFGTHVAIAGSKDQNAIAMLDVSSSESWATRLYQRQQNDSVFVGYAQGNFHERLTGDSLWEMGILGKDDAHNATGTVACESTNSSNITQLSDLQLGTQACDYEFPVRSAIRESYTNVPGYSTTQPSNASIQSDINGDGYADVLVSTDLGSDGLASIYTFFGNYAADFSYASNLQRNDGLTSPYSTSSNCIVTNYSESTMTNTLADVRTDFSLPFSTFTWKHSVASDPTYTITATYPVRPHTAGQDVGDYELRLGYLGDTTDDIHASWSYSDISYTAGLKTRMESCLPQRRTYYTAPTAITTADLNDDHFVDGAIGFSKETSGTGMARILLASSASQRGLGSDFVYNAGVGSYAQAGSSIVASQWRFMSATDSSYPEITRRDLFVGAPYQNRGNGAVLAYSGYSGAAISSTNPTTLSMTIPIPSDLNTDQSKIIGDVNGDGYDDIFVPVKRLDTKGTIYYDAVIYFGSAFGPITTPMCLDKITAITKSSGGNISSSDCNASISGMNAFLDSTSIQLPQYFSRPSGMSGDWAWRVQPAGDINGDGHDDLYVIDYDGSKIFAIFGSDIGLMNGNPAMGPSPNKTPQLVVSSSQGQIINFDENWNPVTSSASHVTTPNTSDFSGGANVTIAHGDFNGDGYEDVALGMPGSYSFQMVTSGQGWSCSDPSGSYGTMEYCGFTGSSGSIPYVVHKPSDGRFLASTGTVFVMYGGPQGVQTPVSGSTAVDFDYSRNVSCDSFYHNCYQASGGVQTYYQYGGSTVDGVAFKQATDSRKTDTSTTGQVPFKYSRIVYGSITCNGDSTLPSSGTQNCSSYNISTGTATDPTGGQDPLDTTDGAHETRRPACIPGSGNSAAKCVSTVIPTPYFFNTQDSYKAIQGLQFGSSLTIADVNHDGIDDLLVGDPNFAYTVGGTDSDLTSYKTWGAPTSAETYTSGGDTAFKRHGTVFVYYGAQGYGLVAPTAEHYVGSSALGLTPGTSGGPDANSSVINSSLVFQLYPSFPSSNIPTLDHTENTRNFGMTMTSGDFNGDGIDDVAVASGNGQVYVYYGPICQWDNYLSTSATGPLAQMYANPNQTSAIGSDLSDQCTTFLFDQQSLTSSSNQTPATNVASINKLMPQMINIAGLNGTEWMGSTLLSNRIRHGRNLGNMKNPSNLASGQTASDLIIAGPNANDPNATTVSFKYTGLGYVFFGHTGEALDPTFMAKPGLYIGSPSYSSNITAIPDVDSGGNPISRLYYSPIILRPHSTDGTVGRFFSAQTTTGDLNGDGRMDLLMPTVDLDTTQDGTSASYGGGFRLFY